MTGNDLKNIFNRTISFIEWLSMPERLDSTPPEKPSGAQVRELSFLRSLMAIEALPTDKTGPIVKPTHPGLFQTILSVEPLEKKETDESRPSKTSFVGKLFSREHLSEKDPLDTTMTRKHGLFHALFSFEPLGESKKQKPAQPRASFVSWFFAREHLPQKQAPDDKVSPKTKGFFELLFSLDHLEKEGMPESKIQEPSFLRTILSLESLAHETKNDNNKDD